MKYKSLIVILFSSVLSMLFITACGKPSETLSKSDDTIESVFGRPTKTKDKFKEEKTKNAANIDSTQFSINLDGVNTTNELEDRIEEHLAKCIVSLQSRATDLINEIDTYDKYCDQVEKVSNFYRTVEEETNLMSIMLREYAATYGRMILDSDMSNKEKYRAVDGINDYVYEDACDEIKEKIYDELMDDMKDHFYDGIVEDGKDSAEYSEWYDISTNEYSQWYDTSTKVYGLYYDAATDIYSFYYGLSLKLYNGDLKRAEKVYNRFLQKIEKKKNKGNNTYDISDAKFDTTLRSASTPKELEEVVDSHVSECVQALNKEWSDLSSRIDTYEKYRENVDDVKDFHEHIEESSEQILKMISQYAVVYANLVMESDSSSKDKYNEMDDLKDCIYDDACDYVKDDIYDKLLGDIKDYYYEGILKDAKKNIAFGEWSDARGNAYSWWSDTRGDVYSEWSDTRGDIYSFWTDVRSELFSGDIDKANKKIQKFADKVGF